MNIFADLVKAAVVGSERQSLTFSISGEGLGGLLARLDQTDREGALLGAAAAAALYERAGWMPAKDARSISDPCPADDRPRCGGLSAHHLTRMLQGDFHSVL